MALNIQDVDMDVINSIIDGNKQEAKVEEEVAVLKPLTEFKERKGIKTKLFSELFWKPKDIPDLPLPVFKTSDWDPIAQLMIPEADPNWVWNKAVAEKMALAYYCGDTTLLYGYHGTGKSAVVASFCNVLTIPLWRMSCNQETRETTYVGSPAVEYNTEGQMTIMQEPTVLTDSLRYGGIFLEDEVFRHNASMVVQSLREKNHRTLLLPDAPGRTAAERKLKAPANRWWYFMTDNTVGVGDESGVYEAFIQDASSLDRIDAAIDVPYLGIPEERSILEKATKLDAKTITNMVTFAKTIRKAFVGGTIMSTMSIRPLLAWSEKVEISGDIGMSLRISWFDKLSSDDKAVAKDAFHQQFGLTL